MCLIKNVLWKLRKSEMRKLWPSSSSGDLGRCGRMKGRSWNGELEKWWFYKKHHLNNLCLRTGTRWKKLKSYWCTSCRHYSWYGQDHPFGNNVIPTAPALGETSTVGVYVNTSSLYPTLGFTALKMTGNDWLSRSLWGKRTPFSDKDPGLGPTQSWLLPQFRNSPKIRVQVSKKSKHM